MSEDDQQAPVAASWSRRTLLKVGAVAAAALVLPEAAFGRSFKVRLGLNHPLRRSSYRGLRGERFRVDGGQLIKLERVQDLNSLQAGSETSFALVFSGPAMLDSQVPQLYHPWLGSFRLLLSPGAATAQGRTYVAVINQLASAHNAV